MSRIPRAEYDRLDALLAVEKSRVREASELLAWAREALARELPVFRDFAPDPLHDDARGPY